MEQQFNVQSPELIISLCSLLINGSGCLFITFELYSHNYADKKITTLHAADKDHTNIHTYMSYANAKLLKKNQKR